MESRMEIAKMRPSFEQTYMQFAIDIAQRSTCKRLKVGTVITSTDYRRVLAIGYNGNAAGLDNDACDEELVGNCGCLHSEENAVINCDVPRETRKVVFCTHLPCVMCAKRLVNLGNVIKVYFDQEYRSVDSFAIFEASGIKVEQLNVG